MSHEPAQPPTEAPQAALAGLVATQGRRRRRPDAPVLLAVALGGGLGAPARYGVARLAPTGAGGFPWGTLAINSTGSFALGLVLALVIERFPPTRHVRPFVATGFLGAYTTYSTFAVETDLLVRDGSPALALAYVAACLVAGLAAVWAGIWAARALPLPRRAPARSRAQARSRSGDGVAPG